MKKSRGNFNLQHFAQIIREIFDMMYTFYLQQRIPLDIITIKHFKIIYS